MCIPVVTYLKVCPVDRSKGSPELPLEFCLRQTVQCTPGSERDLLSSHSQIALRSALSAACAPLVASSARLIIVVSLWGSSPIPSRLPSIVQTLMYRWMERTGYNFG